MDGPPPPEVDFSVIPISDRLVHKNWKARVNAYESLIKVFQTTASDSDPAFKPYLNNLDLLRKVASDSNAVAQEKAIECLVALVKFAGETAARTRGAVVPTLVDKCLGSTRAGTRNHALELILQYVEVQNGGAGVVEDLLPGLGAKQPKTASGCVTALKEIVRNFGTQVTPPANLLKSLPKIFSHNDKVVRAEGVLLVQTLYQYIGLAIEPWLAELKPVQIKELKESFDAMDAEGKGKGSLKPARITREQARELETRGDAEADAPADAEPEEPATLDFAEPVDIVPNLPKTLTTALGSSKWKERKEVLDELLAVLNSTPRIKEASEFGEVVKALASRIQGDANINCVMTAAACVEAFAKGLRTGFARYREISVPPMLERLKERKATVTDAIGAALDAVFTTTTLPDIIPDIIPALSNKNPQVKEGALKFLGRCLSTATTPVQPGQLKLLADPLGVLLEDGFENARNEAAICLGTLMKMVGERPLAALMESLADVRRVKVKEAYDKATVKCKATGAPPKAAPPPKSKDAPVKKKAPAPRAPPAAEFPDEDTLPPPKSSATKSAKAKKPPTANGVSSGPPGTSSSSKKPNQPGAAKPAKSAAPAAPGVLDTFKFKHTPEEADALAAELIPASFLTGLGDANWKTRLATLDEMSTWLEGVVADVDAEVVVRALGKKDWNEKNFQVSAKIYNLLVTLATQCPSFGRSCIALSVAHLSEKLADAKLKKPAGEALTTFAEKTSLQFVLNQAYEPLSKQKAPKVLADAITWMDTTLTEFGIAGLSLKSFIEFLKNALKNSNAAVRTNATKALVTVKLFAGSGIKDLLEDLNPQLLSTILSEFDKIEGTPPPVPSRTSADVPNIPASSSSKAVVGDPLEELFPRVELDSLLKGTNILADAKSDAWKTKKEALEALQGILDQGQNKRLKPALGEIGQVLKARVTDTNKAVQTLALDIVSRIATGMGKPFEKQTKLFTLPIATVLSDQKAPIRAAALQTLTAIATACSGLDSMVPGLATALETTNPVQKSNLLQWLVSWFNEQEPPTLLDISAFTAPIVASLDDRNSDVRKSAQAMLPVLISCAGFDHVMQQANSLKPASRASAVPLIQAARPAAALTAPSAVSVATTGATNTPAVTESPPSSPLVTDAKLPAAGKLTGIRRKLPQGPPSMPESRAETPADTASARISSKPGIGIKKPAGNTQSSLDPSSQSTPVGSRLPLSGANVAAKKTRLSKDGQRWINEAGTTRKDLAETLQHQMESHASKELTSLLFSHDHNAVNDHIAGLTMICDFFTSAEAGDNAYGLPSTDMADICLANFDLPLKYVSIKAHEPQTNLISKCLDTVEAILAFLRSVNYQLTDAEALCFIPTMIFKLGDAREPTRVRVQSIVQGLPKVYAYSRVFQLLLEYGLKSKVAKTRQNTLDDMSGILKRSGLGACEPSKAFPVIGQMIADKDGFVRKAALNTLSEGYLLAGEKIWSLVGSLPPREKTQLEEKLRRVAGPSNPVNFEPAQPAQVARLAGNLARPPSPATATRPGGITGPVTLSPTVGTKLARPVSPVRTVIPESPGPTTSLPSTSPRRLSRAVLPSEPAPPPSPTGIGRPKSMLPSRLSRPKSNLRVTSGIPKRDDPTTLERVPSYSSTAPPQNDVQEGPDRPALSDQRPDAPDDITVTISSILSSDSSRSVEALKRIQRTLAVGVEAGPSSVQYQELAEHTEGLIETITLQMAHVFERQEDLISDENFRLAKHLIQTLNNFCDHTVLAESLTVDILTSLLEELTLRLLETDDSSIKEVKDISRFINMIILRLFATGRRMSIFRALFALLLQIVKPFTSNGTLPESKESRIAELVLKCIWKLARNIPQDLTDHKLDAVELFPAIEHFLQSVPPNEWRARATNKVPCGDMPLRTIKVIIQHVVAHYGDEVYDTLSASFDDPSATIVYPYVYRILNSNNAKQAAAAEAAAIRQPQPAAVEEPTAALAPAPVPTPAPAPAPAPPRPFSETSSRSSRPISPQGTSSSAASHLQSSPSRRTSPTSLNGHGQNASYGEEPDPDVQLLKIIGHISSETTGALHKEGITELHHFLKAYPHKRQRVEKLLDSTGAAFRKYINRALASRAAEDQERDVAVANTLSKLESKLPNPSTSEAPHSPRHRPISSVAETEEKLSRLHNLFQYRSSTGSSHGRTTPSVIAAPPTSRI